MSPVRVSPLCAALRVHRKASHEAKAPSEAAKPFPEVAPLKPTQSALP
jgi:hypothetical protein